MIRRSFPHRRPTWREAFLAVAREAEAGSNAASDGCPDARSAGRNPAFSTLHPRVSPVRRMALAGVEVDA
jgi:hypothetical protein